MNEVSLHTIAYASMNAIGNTLNLEEMLKEVISTFVCQTGAIGGKFLTPSSETQCSVHQGSEFSIPAHLGDPQKTYTLHTLISTLVLDIPVGKDHFLFAYQEENNIAVYGSIFSNLATKLINAIEGCRLLQQVVEAKSKHEITEKMMITQSRMAIMGEMIGMIAHQWRQPITVIGMITNNIILTLEYDTIDKQQLLDDLNVVDKQIHYLSSTIDDFRNFFRPNKLPQTLTLDEISNDLLTMLGKNYKNFGINLTFEGDTKLPFISYKNELIQVFLNILTNAKDAFEERHVQDPFILFRASENKDAMTFSIQDNAGGIPETIIDNIFDPYFSTKKEKNGTGLGLYMSAIIVEKHLNGSIAVSSDLEGTLFTLTIPINYDKDMTYVF